MRNETTTEMITREKMEEAVSRAIWPLSAKLTEAEETIAKLTADLERMRETQAAAILSASRAAGVENGKLSKELQRVSAEAAVARDFLSAAHGLLVTIECSPRKHELNLPALYCAEINKGHVEAVRLQLDRVMATTAGSALLQRQAALEKALAWFVGLLRPHVPFMPGPLMMSGRSEICDQISAANALLKGKQQP